MKIRDASDKANAALDDAAAKVERAKLTKWILVALAVLLLVAVGLWFSKARATGWHHVVVKPPVVVAPPVVVTPPVPAPVAPPVVAPVAPPPAVATTPPPAPAQQPAAAHKGPGVMAYAVMAGVAIYFGAVIRSHMIWCAEDDKKAKKDRKCYRPLRDGLP